MQAVSTKRPARLALPGKDSPQYKDRWYLLFWPVFLLRYMLIESIQRGGYTEIYSPLDDRIPFCEYFLIFYVAWYVLIVGMHLYTYVYDPQAFRGYSRALIAATAISTSVFLLFPSCQQLRPETFPRDGLFTRLVEMLYAVDTNTNVLPSEHAIGAFLAFLAVLHTKRLRSPGKIVFFAVLAVLVAMSTVFLKQHSILDVLAALPVTAVGYWLGFHVRKRGKNV